MSVELERLYQDIYSDFEVRLLTTSCFNKKIDWFHVIENREFIYLLHGGELIFNTSISTESDDLQIEFIDRIALMNAHGLIISCPNGHTISEKVIQHCNNIEFPFFFASWDTSYSKIMRRFSEILLDHERNETNLISALKNAIFYPQDEQLYLNHFERNGFFEDSLYIVSIIGPSHSKTEHSTFLWDSSKVEKSLHYLFKQSIIYEEKERLVLMTNEVSIIELKEVFHSFCQTNQDIQIGIGQTVNHISDLHNSYKNATLAFQMCNKIFAENPLSYDDLGIYQILANVKDSDTLYPAFVRKTLGKLIAYDNENKTSYMQVLKDFFDNNCSIKQTAEATFFHQNTLKYKIKNIKEILGYDITTNENRIKIMISLYILHMASDFFFDK